MKKSYYLILLYSLINICCSDKTEVESPSILGKWNIQGMGAVTNNKNYDATVEELKKYPINILKTPQLSNLNLDLREDGTYNFGNDFGNYSINKELKFISFNSSNYKDATDKFLNYKYEITLLKNSELKLGFKKILKKENESDYDVSNDQDGFASQFYSELVLLGKGLNNYDEIVSKSTSLQTTINFKR